MAERFGVTAPNIIAFYCCHCRSRCSIIRSLNNDVFERQTTTWIFHLKHVLTLPHCGYGSSKRKTPAPICSSKSSPTGHFLLSGWVTCAVPLGKSDWRCGVPQRLPPRERTGTAPVFLPFQNRLSAAYIWLVFALHDQTWTVWRLPGASFKCFWAQSCRTTLLYMRYFARSISQTTLHYFTFLLLSVLLL